MREHRPLLRAAAIRLAEERLLDEDLSPREIATTLSVSLRTLYRAFADTDESIMEYIRRRRLELARQDLISADRSVRISEVALRWHFADSSHFIRAFHRRYGVTPARAVAPTFATPSPYPSTTQQE